MVRIPFTDRKADATAEQHRVASFTEIAFVENLLLSMLGKPSPIFVCDDDFAIQHRVLIYCKQFAVFVDNEPFEAVATAFEIS